MAVRAHTWLEHHEGGALLVDQVGRRQVAHIDGLARHGAQSEPCPSLGRRAGTGWIAMHASPTM